MSKTRKSPALCAAKKISLPCSHCVKRLRISASSQLPLPDSPQPPPLRPLPLPPPPPLLNTRPNHPGFPRRNCCHILGPLAVRLLATDISHGISLPRRAIDTGRLYTKGGLDTISSTWPRTNRTGTSLEGVPEARYGSQLRKRI